MSKPSRNLLVMVLLATLGCFGEVADPENPDPVQPRLTLLLTDAADTLLASATVDIGEVTALNAEGVSVTLAASGGVHDLLTLQDGVTALLGSVDVPAATYSELRLVIEGATVVLREGYQFTDGTRTQELRVPSGATSGVKVKLGGADGENGSSGVRIATGETVIVVDFDVTQNFKIQGNPSTPAGIKGFLFTPVLRAAVQNLAGSISGTVQDSDGQPLAKVRVEAAGLDPDVAVAGAVTDGSGAYTIRFLPPGQYVVSIPELSDTTVVVGVDAGQSATGPSFIVTVARKDLSWALISGSDAAPSTSGLISTTTYAPELDAIFLILEKDNRVGQLWKFDLTNDTWSEVVTTAWPIGKFRQFTFDPTTRSILTFWDGLGQVFAVDAVQGGAWQELGSNGRDQQYYEGAAFMSPADTSLTLFGGYGWGRHKNTQWRFDRSTNVWSLVPLSAAPSPRMSASITTHAPTDRVYLFGGWIGFALNDFWQLDAGTNSWTQLWVGDSGNQLTRSAIAVNPSATAVYRFGGSDARTGGKFNTLSRFDLGASDGWQEVEVVGELPAARHFAASRGLFYDVTRDRLVLIGGIDQSNTWLADVWTISLQ